VIQSVLKSFKINALSTVLPSTVMFTLKLWWLSLWWRNEISHVRWCHAIILNKLLLCIIWT